MDNQVFRKLKSSIDKLRLERSQVQQELGIDKRDLQDLQTGMTKLNQEMQAKSQILKQKQRKLKQYEKMIQQTQRSYNIIIDTSNKLSNALQNQGNHLRSRIRKY